MSSLDQRVQEAVNKKLKPGGVWYAILAKEARRLYELIEEEIQGYYRSYRPLVYERTGAFYDSLRIKANNDGFEIYFDPRLAKRKSIYPNSSSKEVFIPTLLNQGWYTSDKAYHFTYYEGYTFIENAVARFKATTQYPISIHIQSRYYPDIYESIV